MSIPVDTMNSIVCWEVMRKARKEAPLHLKIHITKWVSGETATGTVMVQRKQRQNSKCPMCHEPNETTSHILQCTSTSMQQVHEELLKEMKLWLETVQTQHDISNFLCKGLQSWFLKKEYDIEHDVEPNIKIAFETH